MKTIIIKINEEFCNKHSDLFKEDILLHFEKIKGSVSDEEYIEVGKQMFALLIGDVPAGVYKGFMKNVENSFCCAFCTRRFECWTERDSEEIGNIIYS
jgi:hypothetical protein